MKIKQAAFVAVLLCLFSCQSRNELSQETLESLVTVHSVNTTSLNGRLFIPLDLGKGEKIYVSRIPLLTNKDIVHSRPLQYTTDQYGLALQLTFRGAIRWQQTSVEYHGRQLVLAIGGKYKCKIVVGRDRKSSRENIKIAAPLSKEEAEEISKDIIRNYEEIKEKS
jgi:hypothetical protein